MKKRLDQMLVDLGLAPSRTKAQELISRGEVFVKNKNSFTAITKPSTSFADSVEIFVEESELLKYVSRAGLKLEGALKDF